MHAQRRRHRRWDLEHEPHQRVVVVECGADEWVVTGLDPLLKRARRGHRYAGRPDEGERPNALGMTQCVGRRDCSAERVASEVESLELQRVDEGGEDVHEALQRVLEIDGCAGLGKPRKIGQHDPMARIERPSDVDEAVLGIREPVQQDERLSSTPLEVRDLEPVRLQRTSAQTGGHAPGREEGRRHPTGQGDRLGRQRPTPTRKRPGATIGSHPRALYPPGQPGTSGKLELRPENGPPDGIRPDLARFGPFWNRTGEGAVRFVPVPDPHQRVGQSFGTTEPEAGRARPVPTCKVEPVGDLTAWRTHVRRMWVYASDPYPPPIRTDALGRFLYGVAQPLFGARFMLRDRGLLGTALAPVMAVAVVCLLVALRKLEEGPLIVFITFFGTFAALIPVPPVLFARFYARMAAKARNDLGLGPCTAYLKPISQSFVESIGQVIIIAIGVAPLTVLISLVPLWGAIVAFAVQALWTLHWVVVEGFDNARTLEPGQTVASVSEEERRQRMTPWFMRIHDMPMHGAARVLLLPLRVTAEIVMGLSREWAPEMKTIERNPWLSAGFGVGTVILLAIPGLNLFFRPATAIAGAHLCTRIAREPSDG